MTVLDTTAFITACRPIEKGEVLTIGKGRCGCKFKCGDEKVLKMKELEASFKTLNHAEKIELENLFTNLRVRDWFDQNYLFRKKFDI